jgi:hypothetical protein
MEMVSSAAAVIARRSSSRMRPRRIVPICSTPERSRSGPIRGSQDASSDRPRKATFTVDLVAGNSDLAEDVLVDGMRICPRNRSFAVTRCVQHGPDRGILASGRVVDTGVLTRGPVALRIPCVFRTPAGHSRFANGNGCAGSLRSRLALSETREQKRSMITDSTPAGSELCAYALRRKVKPAV